MGNNIKYFREKNGMTQKDLSQATGIQQPKISLYEKDICIDNLTVGTLRKISAALNCTIEALINDEKAFEKYTIRNIKAVARVDLDEMGISADTIEELDDLDIIKSRIQDAVLVHFNDDEFNESDCIIFDSYIHKFDNDEDVECTLQNEYCPIWYKIVDDTYISN